VSRYHRKGFLKTFSFSMEFPEEVLPRFRAIAEREGRSMSQIVEELIKEYVERHEKGNPQLRIDTFTGFSEPPETYELLELLRKRYEIRRVITWSEALHVYRDMMADRVKIDLLEKVLRILERDGWRITWPTE